MKLSPLFDNHMILQRDRKIWISGSVEYDPKQNLLVKVTFAGEEYETTTNEHGEWFVELPEHSAKGPYEMIISCPESLEPDIHLHDIFIGDGFLLTGQSNMELPVARTLDLYAKEVKNAANPLIRMFQVPKKYCYEGPQNSLEDGCWIEVNEQSVYAFSALGYFFAVQKYEEDQVPVGLVHAAVGGAHIEAFLPKERLLAAGDQLRIRDWLNHKPSFCKCDKNGSCKYCYEKILIEEQDQKAIETTIASDINRQKEWSEWLDQHDQGLLNRWFDSEWNQENDNLFIPFPMLYDGISLGQLRGSIWLRMEVEVPKEWIGEEVILKVGSLVDADVTYVNGIEVGRTEYRYPPRRYHLTPDILKEGVNVIIIRLIVSQNTGGAKKDMPYGLYCNDQVIPLPKVAAYRIGAVTSQLEGATFFEWKPCGLYNAMIAPLKNYEFKAILWYQGESNSENPDDYDILLRELITEFRELFGATIMFLYAQLPDFEGEGDEIGTNRWDRLRRAQKKAKDMPNTGMIVLYDLGQYNELHPQNKKDVAGRFLDQYRMMEKL